MPKTKVQKNQVVDYLKTSFNEKRSAVLVDYKGLTVKEIETLRKKLAESNIKFSIIKNSLLKIVLDDQKIVIDKEILDRPIAIGFSDDEVTLSKDLVNAKKTSEKLDILGGVIEKEFTPEDTIIRLSKLPSREELYAKIVGSLNAPLSGMVNVLSGNIRNLIYVLNNYKESIN